MLLAPQRPAAPAHRWSTAPPRWQPRVARKQGASTWRSPVLVLPIGVAAQEQVQQPRDRVGHDEMLTKLVPVGERTGERAELARRVVAHEHLEQELEEHAHAANRGQQEKREVGRVSRRNQSADHSERWTLEELDPREALDSTVLVCARARLGCA